MATDDITKTFKIHLDRAEALTRLQLDEAKRLVEPLFGANADPQVIATIALTLATNLQTAKNA